MILALILLAQGIAGYGSIQLPPPPQQITAGHRDFVSVKDFNSPCNGVGDDVPALTAAIAAMPFTGGVVDARSCTSMTIGSTLTISKGAVTVLLPSATISMGANQIVVPVGVHNVALIGAVPYGGSVASQTAGAGTFLTYTGTGTAILVGDSTGDTYGFTLQDVTLGLTTAGTAAIGIQLNRSIRYVLRRVRVHGFTSANTQVAIDLEGGANFTGGRIEDYYLWNGNTGVLFGRDANANTVSGGTIVNNVAGGTCFNFLGLVGVNPAEGNLIIGGDCEDASGTALSYDYAFGNYVFGLHTEAVTTLVNASANSVGNVMFMAENISQGTITDNGVNTADPNSFNTRRSAQFNTTNWKLYNRTDTATTLDLYGGATAAQSVSLNLHRLDAGRGWQILKSSADNLLFLPNDGNTRLEMDTAGATILNAEGANFVGINQSANSGTQGLKVFSGGASPALGAAIIGNGSLVQIGLAFASLGVPSNGTLIYCTDCTIANPCAGAGTGAFAKRLNGVWVCN